MSEKMKEADLVRMLRKRYSGAYLGANKFTRASHVPLGLSWNRTRICDFIAVGMHSVNSGPDKYHYPEGYEWAVKAPVFYGHEIKVSRSDWLAELRDPSKAESFREYMNFWFLVVSDKNIVKNDLPEGWGLMVGSPKSLRIVVQPTVNENPKPLSRGLQGGLLRATARTEVAAYKHEQAVLQQSGLI